MNAIPSSGEQHHSQSALGCPLFGCVLTLSERIPSGLLGTATLSECVRPSPFWVRTDALRWPFFGTVTLSECFRLSPFRIRIDALRVGLPVPFSGSC
jgi:hypothetical protein